MNFEIWETAVRGSSFVSNDERELKTLDNSRSILRRVDICTVFDFDRFERRFDQSPELPLEMILDRNLFRPNIVFTVT